VSRCLEVASNDDEALYAVSLIELLHGRWREAWPRYERRIALKIGIPEAFFAPPWPPWRGERLRDELLVLRGEQGLGDHLLFSCFGAHLAKLGYRIALWTKPSLEPLLRTVPGVERVVSDIAALEGTSDLRWTSMMSVPGILDVTPETVPRSGPFLTADASGGAFLDTAAVMMNLDLIVTPCNAIAHLAGALGRPTFVALMQVPEWRWLLDRDDSPWYPATRLFRQSRAGDWPGVSARIADAVRARTAHQPN
jgi:hypothetical protein